MIVLTSDQPGFWESRYQARKTLWDLGGPYPPLVRWLEKHPGLGHALVVGCGKGYDAVVLAEHGYRVTAIDFAPSAIAEAKQLASERRVKIRFLTQDLFEMSPEFNRSFDWVFEHACLCAIPTLRWSDYEALMARLLAPGGRLIGGFFTGCDPEGPPFGISMKQLQGLLAPHFELVSTSQIPEALGEERWAEFRRVQD